MCILGAITLPSFLSQAGKAKESEPKQYIGSMNCAQKGKIAENGTFANSVDKLELGIKTDTVSYKYSVKVLNKAAFNYGVSKNENMKSYVGAVFLLPATNVDTKTTKNEMTTKAIMCVTKFLSKTQPANPLLKNE